MRKVLAILWFLALPVAAQELNCTVQINSDKVQQTNQQIFKTLEKSLAELINKTKWTNQTFRQKERIECTFFITVNAYASDQFSGTLQVQSSRPVYGSTYSTPVFNFNDKDINFRYVEFENLIYNPNSFDSNLVSLVAFYSYMILAMDADTFSPLGGTQYYETAQSISALAQQGGFKGWSQADGNQNRFFLANDMLSGTFEPIRNAMYTYHLEGLDVMADNQKAGKEKIKAALQEVSKLYAVRPNAFLTRVFFDAKADEIQTLFSSGPAIDISGLQELLTRISPMNASKWTAIKN
ncbi:DUF4835 family protein [Flavobacterium sp. HJ-32-4]|uniref:type IX secretion system protein PorD n=1 Tax=Flavobacterium sp. HJ-32-4 TaxID=1160795 RepID=UPI001F13E09D|nr:DUF4835 family protein [Flavobacterium sp. HJ-32-4]UMY64409.1 DUF4835 family protein [Flavobacterium sp. HJ-32-4]